MPVGVLTNSVGMTAMAMTAEVGTTIGTTLGVSFCEGQGVTMPFVDEAFSQSTAAKIFLACGALKFFFHFRLRRA